MQYSHRKLYLTLLTAVLLTACNNGNNDTGSSSNGALQQLTSNMGDSKEIMDPDALEQNINSLFGSADSEPVAVNAGDSVSSLIGRNNN